MRIRNTTGPCASPPPGRNQDNNHHQRASIGDGYAAAPPLRSTASITGITVLLSGGGR